MNGKITIPVLIVLLASRGVIKTEAERISSNSMHKRQLGIFPPEIDFRFPAREPIYL